MTTSCWGIIRLFQDVPSQTFSWKFGNKTSEPQTKRKCAHLKELKNRRLNGLSQVISEAAVWLEELRQKVRERMRAHASAPSKAIGLAGTAKTSVIWIIIKKTLPEKRYREESMRFSEFQISCQGRYVAKVNKSSRHTQDTRTSKKLREDAMIEAIRKYWGGATVQPIRPMHTSIKFAPFETSDLASKDLPSIVSINCRRTQASFSPNEWPLQVVLSTHANTKYQTTTEYPVCLVTMMLLITHWDKTSKIKRSRSGLSHSLELSRTGLDDLSTSTYDVKKKSYAASFSLEFLYQASLRITETSAKSKLSTAAFCRSLTS